MNTRLRIMLISLPIFLLLVAGCNPQGLHVIVQNHSNEAIFRGVVSFGSGNFEIARLKPGETHHALISPVHLGSVDFRFVDKAGRFHYSDKGPTVGLDYNGEITIEIKDDYKMEFHGEVKPTPGTTQPVVPKY